MFHFQLKGITDLLVNNSRRISERFFVMFIYDI